MDGHRFDDLTKKLAAGTSRRGFFKVLAGGVAAGVAAVRATGADAARPPRQPNGASCSRATDCASFTCADGVCCDKTCSGQCEACNLADREGTCSPVTGAPVGQRQACPGSGPCATTCDGVTRTRCDGTPPPDTTCAAPTCSGGWLMTHTCGSNGACVPTSTNCAPYGCDPSGTACATGCQSDAQCGGGSVCVGGQCQAALPLGGACTAGSQCQSGLCAQDVCCAEACDDPCYSCDLPGTVGFCTPTPGVQCDDGNPCTEHDVCQNNGDCEGTPMVCDPRGVCETATCNPATGGCDFQPATGEVCGEATAPCELPAVCDGVSLDCPPNQVQPDTFVCRPASCENGLAVPPTTCDGAGIACPDPAAGEPCPDAICSGATDVTAHVCQGDGVCVPTTQDCGLYFCVNGACPNTCADNDDCIGAAHCAAGVCQGDRALGQSCETADQCVSGHCIDDVCCDTACDGPCQSCASGTCQGTTGGTCGGTGDCAATCQDGACVYPGEETDCHYPECIGGTFLERSVCDGEGGCIAHEVNCHPFTCVATTQNCDGSFCNVGACSTSCSEALGCSQDAYCDDGVCREATPNGAACTVDAVCASGFCVDGICCDAACGGQCEACDLPGSIGTCTALPAETRSTCAGYGSVCSGVCDGTRRDVCIYPGTDTHCMSAACFNHVLLSATYCDGAGNCVFNEGTVQDCSPFDCTAIRTACRDSCEFDTHCAPGFRCGASGLCGDFRDNGGPCTTAVECLSNSCVEGACRGDTHPGGHCAIPDDCASGSCEGGFCCSYACVSECATCETGICALRTTGPCGTAGPCQGTCNEGALCSYPGDETFCEGPVCIDGVTTHAICNGFGVCQSPTTENCEGFDCNASGTGCRVSCAIAEDCDDDHYCGQGECLPSKVIGETCGDGKECYSGSCVDARCVCAAENDGATCAPDRVCCGEVCCGEGGECQGGVCTVACLEIGEDCTSTGQCCLDGDTTCFSDFRATSPNHWYWDPPAGYSYDPSARSCCRPFGASCTTDADCCNSQHLDGSSTDYAVACSPEGICGGAGAICPSEAGNFDYSCETSVCCAKFRQPPETGTLRECCSEDEVCDPYALGGCNNGVEIGGQCTTDRDCMSGTCRDNICCDYCGGQCGKPLPNGTPCVAAPATYPQWDSWAEDMCCDGTCVNEFNSDHCGACGHACLGATEFCLYDTDANEFYCPCTDDHGDGSCGHAHSGEFGHCRPTALGETCTINATCGEPCTTHEDCADFEEVMYIWELCNVQFDEFMQEEYFACSSKATCSFDPNHCTNRCVPVFVNRPPIPGIDDDRDDGPFG